MADLEQRDGAGPAAEANASPNAGGSVCGKKGCWSGRLGLAFAWALVLPGVFWAALALQLDAPGPRWAAAFLCVLWLAGCAYATVRFRARWQALRFLAVGVLIVMLCWLQLPPRNDRDWAPEVARLAKAKIEGNRLTVNNVRNFYYSTAEAFAENWETRSYNLDKLRSADIFISFWGPTLIAHTIASWEFSDGPPLAISIETRREKGESYSALRGFFRQFELYYVVADERDLIGLRTNHRGERVYLYRVQMSPAAAKAVLLDYLKEVNRLAEKPVWYNAASQNCTTTIRGHALQAGAGKAWDWRILLNGRIDELSYERGTFDASLPFAELKARSDITDKAKAAGAAADFSTRIRKGLPGMETNP